MIFIRDAEVIKQGKPVRVVFSEGPLIISGLAVALQSGGVGDVLSLRNIDSGTVIRGIVRGTARSGSPGHDALARFRSRRGACRHPGFAMAAELERAGRRRPRRDAGARAASTHRNRRSTPLGGRMPGSRADTHQGHRLDRRRAANQLVGYGLVIGLNGTGDSLRNAPFTEQSLQSMLDRMGVNIRKTQSRTRNVAAVIVTAELPAFIGRGSRIDITVSSLGDATSLVGGSLIMTPLAGPDNRIYAVAQGPVVVSGFSAGGAAETVTQNVPTSARIPNGALSSASRRASSATTNTSFSSCAIPISPRPSASPTPSTLYSHRPLRRPAGARARSAHDHARQAAKCRGGPVHRRDRQSARSSRTCPRASWSTSAPGPS